MDEIKNIIWVLRNENTRISVGDRWLVWDEGLWRVYERKYKQKNTRYIIATSSEEDAVLNLISKS